MIAPPKADVITSCCVSLSLFSPVFLQFFIENVLDELDAPGEWFFDHDAHKLYLWYNATGAPPTDGSISVTQLPVLINSTGTQAKPVVGLSFLGLTFADSAPFFMGPHGTPSGGDWAGALVFGMSGLCLEGPRGTSNHAKRAVYPFLLLSPQLLIASHLFTLPALRCSFSTLFFLCLCSGAQRRPLLRGHPRPEHQRLPVHPPGRQRLVHQRLRPRRQHHSKRVLRDRRNGHRPVGLHRRVSSNRYCNNWRSHQPAFSPAYIALLPPHLSSFQ